MNKSGVIFRQLVFHGRKCRVKALSMREVNGELTSRIVILEKKSAIADTAGNHGAKTSYVSAYLLKMLIPVIVKTYKPPSKKRQANPTLCNRGKCRFHTIGMGIIKIARSVTIHGIGGIMKSSFLLLQWAEIVGFQLYTMGMQIKQSASTVPIHHSTMIAPIIFIASWNAGVMKMRWKSIRTEVLVKKSEVH